MVTGRDGLRTPPRRFAAAGYPRTRGRPRRCGREQRDPDEAGVASRLRDGRRRRPARVGLRDPRARLRRPAEDRGRHSGGRRARRPSPAAKDVAVDGAREADRAAAVLRPPGLQPGHPVGEHHREDQGDQGRGRQEGDPRGGADGSMGSVLRRRAASHLRRRRPEDLPALHGARHRADRRPSGSGWPAARSPSSRRSAGGSRPRTAISSSATRPTPRASTSVPTPSCSTRRGARQIDAVVNYKWVKPLGMQPGQRDADRRWVRRRRRASCKKLVSSTPARGAACRSSARTSTSGRPDRGADRRLGGRGGRLLQLHGQPRRHRES